MKTEKVFFLWLYSRWYRLVSPTACLVMIGTIKSPAPDTVKEEEGSSDNKLSKTSI